jgi:hypothetical protein
VSRDEGGGRGWRFWHGLAQTVQVLWSVLSTLLSERVLAPFAADSFGGSTLVLPVLGPLASRLAATSTLEDFSSWLTATRSLRADVPIGSNALRFSVNVRHHLLQGC